MSEGATFIKSLTSPLDFFQCEKLYSQPHSSDGHRNPSAIIRAGHPCLFLQVQVQVLLSTEEIGREERRRCGFLVTGGGESQFCRLGCVGAMIFKNHLQVWFKKIISHQQSQGSQEDIFPSSHSPILPVSRLLKWGLLGHKSLPPKDCQGVKPE